MWQSGVLLIDTTPAPAGIDGDMFLSVLTRLFSHTFGPNRLAVLTYHRVVASPDSMRPDEPTVAQFALQMEMLRRYFNPLSLSEAVQRLGENRLPPRAVCITFDDGYSDNEQLALPVLQRLGVPACIFVATKYLNGGMMWNDRVIEGVRACRESAIDLQSHGMAIYPIRDSGEKREAAQAIITAIKHMDPLRRDSIAAGISALGSAALPELMLSTEQLDHLVRQGVEIGAHTHSHPILCSLDREASRREIVQGKEILEQMTGKRIRYFAYPNGKPDLDYNDSHVDLVREIGFEAAFSTRRGVSRRNSDPLQLPRFTPWDKQPARYAMRLALNYRSSGL